MSGFSVPNPTQFLASQGALGFPATQVPSAGANDLDDYEEGTWTPIDISGAALTFSDASGVYTKVGRLVHFGGYVAYPATSDGSVAIIGGLPFANGATAANRAMYIGISSETTLKGMLIGSSSTGMYLFDLSVVNLTNATMSGDILWFGGVMSI